MSYNQSIKVKPPNTMPLGGKQDGTVLREGVTVFGGGGGYWGSYSTPRKNGGKNCGTVFGGTRYSGGGIGGFYLLFNQK